MRYPKKSLKGHEKGPNCLIPLLRTRGMSFGCGRVQFGFRLWGFEALGLVVPAVLIHIGGLFRW